MICKSIDAFFTRLFFLSVFNICIVLLFFVSILILTKTQSFNCFSAIRTRQKLLSFIITVYIFGLFELSIAFAVWLIAFFLLRYFILKKDKFKLNTLYINYEKNDQPYPTVLSIKKIRDSFEIPETKEDFLREFNYNFTNHVDSSVIPILFCCFGVTNICYTSLFLFGIEYFSLAVCGSFLIWKLLYKAFLNSPQSISYLSHTGTCFLVLFFELIYYLVAILIFYTIVS